MGRLTAVPSRLGMLPSRVTFAPKVAEAFYYSPPWRALVARLKRQRGARCQRPGCGSAKRIIADHIIERKDGGADLDPANIELLCHACHQVKTAAARARRAAGRATTAPTPRSKV